MPTSEPNHDRCRHLVCVVCLGKTLIPYKRNAEPKRNRTITPKLKELIVEHVFDQYIENQDILPCALCDTCRIILRSRGNPDPSKWRPIRKQCDHAQLLVQLKSLSDDVKTSTNCTCDVCRTAKFQGLRKKTVGRPSTSAKKGLPVTLPRCNICHGIRKRGLPHKCNEVEKYKNVQEMLSPKTQEHVSSTFIRQKSKSEITKSNDKSNGMSLRTRGRPMNIAVKGIHKLESPKPYVSHKTLLDIQAKRNLSHNLTLNIAQDLRQGFKLQYSPWLT